jgi:hypothetical protein
MHICIYIYTKQDTSFVQRNDGTPSTLPISIPKLSHNTESAGRPPPSQGRLLLQERERERVLLGLEFFFVMGFTSPFFSWYASSNCNWWKFRYLVVPLTLLVVDPPLLGCLLAWNLVLAPCFFFLSLSQVSYCCCYVTVHNYKIDLGRGGGVHYGRRKY